MHASRLASKDGSPGIAQGYKTYFSSEYRWADERDTQCLSRA
jgi:hypothetical protein